MAIEVSTEGTKALIAETVRTLLAPEFAEPRGHDFNHGGHTVLNGVALDCDGNPVDAKSKLDALVQKRAEVDAEIEALKASVPAETTKPDRYTDMAYSDLIAEATTRNVLPESRKKEDVIAALKAEDAKIEGS